jgi:hypothetical protein
MIEEETKKILQKSMLKTSDSFMNELMNKIEAKEKVEKASVWPIRTTLSVISIILLLMSFVLYKSLHLSNNILSTGISISKTAIFSIASLIFLFIINHILKLNEEYQNLKNDVSNVQNIQ